MGLSAQPAKLNQFEFGFSKQIQRSEFDPEFVGWNPFLFRYQSRDVIAYQLASLVREDLEGRIVGVQFVTLVAPLDSYIRKR